MLGLVKGKREKAPEFYNIYNNFTDPTEQNALLQTRSRPSLTSGKNGFIVTGLLSTCKLRAAGAAAAEWCKSTTAALETPPARQNNQEMEHRKQ